MNARTFVSLTALGASLILAGCTSVPQYPITYQVPLGPAQITNSYGTPHLSVNGFQDVPARPGALLYYQVVSPVNVVFYAFDKNGTNPNGPLLGQMQGTSFYSSVAPTGDMVEFVFSATQPISGGAVQLTASDTPMTNGSNAIPYSTSSMGPTANQQPAVMLSPTSVSVSPGQSVTFTASGGAGSGNFVWGGATAASGWSNLYTFNVPGTYTLTVYRSADGTYAQSNLAVATVNVGPQAEAPAAVSNPAVTVTPIR